MYITLPADNITTKRCCVILFLRWCRTLLSSSGC